MPLIDLKTDLKSLKFGRDRFNGGSSGQPYITSKIPEEVSTLGALDDDFLLRGGVTAVSNSGEDILRLGKMFTDTKSPSGILFLAKQNLLSRTAAHTQTSGILNEGIYTPLSTLAQAGVNAFGGHLNKQGINPFAQTGAYSNNDNLYGVKVKSTQPKSENRLVSIYQNITNNTSQINWNFSGVDLNVGPNILSYGGGPGSVLGIGKTHIRFASPEQRTGTQNPNYQGIQILKSVDISENQVGGLSIEPAKEWTWGGPGGLYSPYSNQFSLGTFSNFLPNNSVNKPQRGSLNNTWYTGSATWTAKQDLPKYDQTKVSGSSFEYGKAFPDSKSDLDEPINNNSVYNTGATFPDGKNPLNFANGTVTMNQKMLATQVPSIDGTYQDFRAVIRQQLENQQEVVNNGKKSGNLTEAPDYRGKNTDLRNQQGIPGNRKNKNYSSYTKGVVEGGKTIALDKINASAVGSDVSQWNDLCTFNITPISGEGAMTFRAFLDDISDNFSAEVNASKFVGRGENFYTYGGFDRSISLGWTVYAQSKPELIPMYQRLSFLASNLAPIYKNGFMQGPLVKLSIGGYFRDMPGYIKGLQYTLTQDSSWDIQINDEAGIDRTTSELPFMIKVSGFNFIPIPTYLPQQGAPMIDMWNGENFNLAYTTHNASNDGRLYGTTVRGLKTKKETTVNVTP